MIIEIVISLILVLPVYAFISYTTHRHRVNNHPGPRQLVSPNGFLARIPFLIPSFIRPYLLPFDRNHTHDLHYNLFKQFKTDILAFVTPFSSKFIVCDPQLVKQITTTRRSEFPKPVYLYGLLDLFGKNIVTTEGDIWKLHRKITAPAFTDATHRLVVEQSISSVNNMINSWVNRYPIVDTKNGKGYKVNVNYDTMQMTLSVISAAGFGVELDWNVDQDLVMESSLPNGHALSFQKSLEIVSLKSLPRLALPKLAFKLLGPMFPALKEIDQGFIEFEKYIHEFVETGKQQLQTLSHSAKNDLLSKLILANSNTSNTNSLTDSELYGNVFIFLLAGHETTAHTLSYALSLLARYPGIQDKLYDNIVEELGEDTSAIPSYEELSKLTYVHAVMNETLRLYPPVVMIPKVAGNDLVLESENGNGNVFIQKGTEVHIQVMAMHHHPKYWGEDVDEFRPERFIKTVDEKRIIDYPKDAFIPFSDGVRSCLGKKFAQLELVVALTMLIHRFRVVLPDEVDADIPRKVFLESESVLTLSTKKPVHLVFVER